LNVDTVSTSQFPNSLWSSLNFTSAGSEFCVQVMAKITQPPFPLIAMAGVEGALLKGEPTWSPGHG
jgi:hypothetical protein